ncbi:SpoIIE family protein phosphatase [Kitasatospora sp. NPDC057015]|uniref:SpoIIE family protein phosphatase n=1 Tax=Kitasatospora sp. NPDC057015 TaxID=3346001 RepID=UPI00362FEBC0
MHLRRPRSLAGQLFALQATLLVVAVAICAIFAYINAGAQAETAARRQTTAVAGAIANSSFVTDAIRSSNPTALLQPYTERVRLDTGVAFITIMNTNGIRWTHPDPRLIGGRFSGHIAPAQQGHTFYETHTGSFGPTVRVVAPIRDGDRIVGLVSAGITVKRINAQVQQQLVSLLGVALAALTLCGLGTYLINIRLRRHTRGSSADELSRMYEHHDAVLHEVREGVLIVRRDGMLLLANDEARRLLSLPSDAEGSHVTGLGLPPGTVDLLTSDRIATDEVHLIEGRLLALNKRFTTPFDRNHGSVVTLRDTTELRALSGRANAARERLKLLYDAGARIGSTLDVTRTAEELAEVAVPRFADIVTVELLDPVLRGEEPSGASTQLRRSAIVGLAEDHPLYALGELIRFAPQTPMAASVEGGRSVVDRDLASSDGWRSQDPQRAQRILDFGIHSLAVVPLRARGVVLGLVNFWRSGTTPPFEEEDTFFADELAGRAAVCIDNARRYTHEHTVAVTLQRSLMPSGFPDQQAVEVAHRYLPAKAGVGGDWFDVIPLPGARVALVVGDVVGHGLHAAATMGWLRVAVHNFAALDLSPDELLWHLDELVTRIDAQAERDGSGRSDVGTRQASTGATCLCTIYDSVSGQVTAATAGHPPPTVVLPDGTVKLLDIPVSPPLGLSAGLPFESAAVTLPEGSSLVLHTDGLIEDSDGLDSGLQTLHDVLGGPTRTPEDTCSAVIEAMLPVRPTDDVALLIARTRRLDSTHVAEWDMPRDPAQVGPVRNACARTLQEWGLQGITFAAELVLSELITNAVRYGSAPVRVRLLHATSLTCEVSDGSSTSPHLRRAKDTDEGGRGLFLVAKYAAHWGTRYSSRGKTIWAELALCAPETPDEEETAESLLGQWDDAEL